MTVNQRSDGSPARGSSPPSSCQGGGLRRCSSDDFILIRLNLMEFKEMRSGAVSVQWLDFLKRRHRDLGLVSKSGLCIFLMHTMDKKSKPRLVGFRRHMLFCHVKVMVGTGQGNAVGVPCWFFLHVKEPFFKMLVRRRKTCKRSLAGLQQRLVPVCCVAGDKHSRQQRVCQEGCWVAAGTFNILWSHTHARAHLRFLVDCTTSGNYSQEYNATMN